MIDSSICHEEGQQILDGIKDVKLDAMEVDKLFKHEHPLEFSPQQRAVVVEELRRNRARYVVQKKEKAAKRARKVKEAETEIEGVDIQELLNIDVKDLIGESGSS